MVVNITTRPIIQTQPVPVQQVQKTDYELELEDGVNQLVAERDELNKKIEKLTNQLDSESLRDDKTFRVALINVLYSISNKLDKK